MTPTNQRLRPLFTALLAILVVSAPAHAGLITVEMFVDGTSVGRQVVSSTSTDPVPIDFSASDLGYAIDGSGLVDFDPFFGFSVSVQNFSENSLIMSFLFQATYVDGAYDTVATEFASTVTDGDRSGGVNLNPLGLSMMTPQVDGADVLAAALGAGCNPLGPAGFTAPCDLFSTTSTAHASLATGNFGAVLSFVVSGGDAASMTGRIELTKDAAPVPEPASILLLGLGAAAVARRRWTRSGYTGSLL